MEELEAKLHRTWLEVLVEGNFAEVAALAVDAELLINEGNWQPKGFIIDLAPSSFVLIKQNTSIQQIIDRTLNMVARGHIYDQNGVPIEHLEIEYRIKLLEPENDWQQIIRDLIANSNDPNQGVVTSKVFARDKKQVYTYNEMKFGSQSEIRIAQELERRRVLFFPLPLAVRNDTGQLYKDHREVDFLICQNGVWGVLEVSHHLGRYEKDSEKDAWLKESGILCVEHRPSETCFSNPAKVVDDFLRILMQYKK
jgi:hypothetical protein